VGIKAEEYGERAGGRNANRPARLGSGRFSAGWSSGPDRSRFAESDAARLAASR
jgi:hypothetical protein